MFYCILLYFRKTFIPHPTICTFYECKVKEAPIGPADVLSSHVFLITTVVLLALVLIILTSLIVWRVKRCRRRGAQASQESPNSDPPIFRYGRHTDRQSSSPDSRSSHPANPFIPTPTLSRQPQNSQLQDFGNLPENRGALINDLFGMDITQPDSGAANSDASGITDYANLSPPT